MSGRPRRLDPDKAAANARESRDRSRKNKNDARKRREDLLKSVLNESTDDEGEPEEKRARYNCEEEADPEPRRVQPAEDEQNYRLGMDDDEDDDEEEEEEADRPGPAALPGDQGVQAPPVDMAWRPIEFTDSEVEDRADVEQSDEEEEIGGNDVGNPLPAEIESDVPNDWNTDDEEDARESSEDETGQQRRRLDDLDPDLRSLIKDIGHVKVTRNMSDASMEKTINVRQRKLNSY